MHGATSKSDRLHACIGPATRKWLARRAMADPVIARAVERAGVDVIRLGDPNLRALANLAEVRALAAGRPDPLAYWRDREIEDLTERTLARELPTRAFTQEGWDAIRGSPSLRRSAEVRRRILAGVQAGLITKP